MKVTYQQIANFRNAARQFIGQKPAQTKLHFAINKMMKRTENHHQDFFDKENDIKIEHAQTDKDGVLLINADKAYSYSKENAKKLQADMRKLGRTEVEVDVFPVKELPKDLEAAWYEYLTPFVIEEKDEFDEQKTE